MKQILALLIFVSIAAQAHHVDPVEIPGNPTCASQGYAHGFRVDPPASGTYVFDGLTVTATIHGKLLDWFGGPLGGVLVKGGPAAHLYDYRPGEESADEDLVSPLNPGGNVPDISHFDFCYDDTHPPSGACCLESQCTITTEQSCQDAGGTYQGDDTTCDKCVVPVPVELLRFAVE